VLGQYRESLRIQAEVQELAQQRATLSDISDAWIPYVAELTKVCGFPWTIQVDHPRGIAQLVGKMGNGVTVTVTDYHDGTLSMPGEQPISVGFTLPDAPWTGKTDSLVHVRDVISADLCIPAICCVVARYLHGNRYGQHNPAGMELSVSEMTA
jgi:uncharacterized protein YlxW (UPF0749 family)